MDGHQGAKERWTSLLTEPWGWGLQIGYKINNRYASWNGPTATLVHLYVAEEQREWTRSQPWKRPMEEDHGTGSDQRTLYVAR
jgi:hypothetical protein